MIVFTALTAQGLLIRSTRLATRSSQLKAGNLQLQDPLLILDLRHIILLKDLLGKVKIIH